MLDNDSQLHHPHLYLLSISPLWPAAWVTFNEDELQLPLFLAATRISWMLMFFASWSFNPHSHPLNRVCCSHLRAYLRVCSNERASESVVIHGRARLFSFPISIDFFSRLLFFSISLSFEVGGEIRSLDLPIQFDNKLCDELDHRATAPCCRR